MGQCCTRPYEISTDTLDTSTRDRRGNKINYVHTYPPLGETEHRWFRNTLANPWNLNLGNQEIYWVQYNLDQCDKIEESFRFGFPQHDLDENYLIKFERKYNQYTQINKNNLKKQRQVIREIPHKVPNILRTERFEANRERMKPYEFNYIDQLSMFSYSQIFRNFQVDESDPLIRSFTSYATLLEKKIAEFLSNEYVRYLKQVHNLGMFDFSKMKDILTVDLNRKNVTQSYVEHYVKDLTQENFYQKIARMYTEEGQLYKMLNKTLRDMPIAIDSHIEYIFYLLCFLFIFGGSDRGKIYEDNDTQLFNGTAITAEEYEKYKITFAEDQVVTNCDFMSTTRNPTLAKNLMTNKNLPIKILFEFQLEKESCADFFLSLKPIDIANASTFPEEAEVILPLNGVLQVTEFIEEKDIHGMEVITTIKLDYRRNLFKDSLSFIERERPLANQYGLYESTRISEDEYLKVAAVKCHPGFDLKLLFGLRNILQLNLWDSRITCDEMKIIAGYMKYLSNLQELELGCNNIGDEGMKVFSEQMMHCKQLLKLGLLRNDIGDEGITAFIGQMSHVAHLLHLDISSNSIRLKGITALAQQLSHVNHLEELRLNHICMTDAGIAILAIQLSHVPHLRLLGLNGNRLTAEGMFALSSQLIHIPQLKHLCLNENGIGDKGLQELSMKFSNIPHLQYLGLCANSISTDGIKALASQLTHIQNLQQLDLKFNMIDNIDPEIINHVLKVLDPSWTFEDWRWERGSSPCTKKKLFTAQFTRKYRQDEGAHIKITHDQFRSINKFLYLQNLTSVDLSWNAIGDEEMKAFATQWIYLSNIKDLNLRRNRIGNEGITEFASQMVHLPNLRHLDLSINCFGDEGMKAFAGQLSHVANLQYLDLSDNHIRDEGIKAFASQLLTYLNHLQQVHLSGNPIGEEGKRTLAMQLVHLTELRIDFLEECENV